ncbi:MAG: VanZ family protein [Eubacterium sp.]
MLYIAGLVYFLFFAEMLDRTGIERSYHYNLIPFREIRRFIVYADLLGPVAVISNLFGNIAIFMPFGFLVPILGRKKRKFWFTALASFELSLSVECIQLITKTGCFDVDDIFLNTIGWEY